MTSAQVVETSVTNNSSFQSYSHPDDRNIYEQKKKRKHKKNKRKQKSHKHVAFTFFCLISAQFVMIMSVIFTTWALLF